MKMSFLLCALSLLAACGNKKTNHDDSTQNESKLGLGTHSECGRAEEVRGSNSVYQWTKAGIGDLQKIIISTETNSIEYQEARADSFLDDISDYRFFSEGNLFFFKTTTKSLKLAFYDSIPLGAIANDETKKEYKVGILTYDDNSGYKVAFLCPKI